MRSQGLGGSDRRHTSVSSTNEPESGHSGSMAVSEAAVTSRVADVCEDIEAGRSSDDGSGTRIGLAVAGAFRYACAERGLVSAGVPRSVPEGDCPWARLSCLRSFQMRSRLMTPVESLKAWDKADDDVKLHAIGVLVLDDNGKVKAHKLGRAQRRQGCRHRPAARRRRAAGGACGRRSVAGSLARSTTRDSASAVRIASASRTRSATVRPPSVSWSTRTERMPWPPSSASSVEPQRPTRSRTRSSPRPRRPSFRRSRKSRPRPVTT